ncbi:MAG: hypothetical protein LBG64_02010 [Pseudomonadales bacterium]|jgi:hypothetical protein|nr:hypothetical protein [Pseudomonadales bacterium]
MLKDALISLGLVVTLLVFALVSGFFPGNINTTITFAGDTITDVFSDDNDDCETDNCVVVENTSVRTNSDESLSSREIIESVSDHLNNRTFRRAVVSPNINIYENDQLWWRNSDDFRLVISDAHSVIVEVNSSNQNFSDENLNTHPASRDNQIRRATNATSRHLRSLGFRRRSFNECPINHVGDPFNNCINYFEKDDIKCSLIVGFGSTDNTSNRNILRMELTCSDNYYDLADMALPLMRATQLLNPQWKTTDMAVFSVIENDGYYRIYFGDRQADRHAIFSRVNNSYTLLYGGRAAISCADAEYLEISTEISRCI